MPGPPPYLASTHTQPQGSASRLMRRRLRSSTVAARMLGKMCGLISSAWAACPGQPGRPGSPGRSDAGSASGVSPGSRR